MSDLQAVFERLVIFNLEQLEKMGNHKKISCFGKLLNAAWAKLVLGLCDKL